MSSPEPPSSPRPRIRKAHSFEHEYSGPRTGGADAPGAGGSAAHDRSTYYEYIARQSAELPAQQGPPHGPSGSGSVPSHPARAQGAPAEAPVTHGAVPPRPTKRPTAGPAPAAPGAASASAGGTAAGRTSAAAPGDHGVRRRRTGPVLIGVIATLAVLALGIGLGVAFLGPDRGIQATDIESPGSSSAADSPAPDDTGGAPATADEQLSAHVTDGTRVAEEQLADQWVVQLSAKKPGLEANGRTWDDQAILEEFEENQRRHPEAILLWSGDWSSFRLADFWVTVLAEPYDSPDEALATCTNLGLDRDNCFAKKLSTSEGPDGTTALND